MATQARPARVTTMAETQDLARFIRSEGPPSFLQDDEITPGGFKWKKAFSNADALNKSRVGLTTMWHDCTSLIGLGSLFKLDVKELDSSFRPTRAAPRTTSAGSKYMAIKPKGYRGSTQPRSISHAPPSRIASVQSEGRRDPEKDAHANNHRQSPEYIGRTDSCVESNKEVVPTAAESSIGTHTTSSQHAFEVDGHVKLSSNSRARNSFSSRSWVEPTSETLEIGYVRNGSLPLPPRESFEAHRKGRDIAHTNSRQGSIDQIRPRSSPQESTGAQRTPRSAVDVKSSPDHTRKGLHSTPPTRSRVAYSELSSDDACVCSNILSGPTLEQSTFINKSTTRNDTHGLPMRSPRHSPDHSLEKYASGTRATPANRPRRSDTSKSEKGRRMTSAVPPRPRALSAQLGRTAKPPDSPMEPVPPVPPPQLDVKQDLLLEALPPLDIPAAAAVEEMITESRESVRKLKTQNIWPDTPTSLQQQDDTKSLMDETSNLSRLERENARLRAILYMYVVDS